MFLGGLGNLIGRIEGGSYRILPEIGETLRLLR